MAQANQVQCRMGVQVGIRHGLAGAGHSNATQKSYTTPLSETRTLRVSLGAKSQAGVNTSTGVSPHILSRDLGAPVQCRSQKSNRGWGLRRKKGTDGNVTQPDDAKKIQELLATNEQLRKRVEELEAIVKIQSPPTVKKTSEDQVVPEAQLEGAPEAKLEDVPEAKDGEIEGVPETKQAKLEGAPDGKLKGVLQAVLKGVFKANVEDEPDAKLEGAPNAKLEGAQGTKVESALRTKVKGAPEAKEAKLEGVPDVREAKIDGLPEAKEAKIEGGPDARVEDVPDLKAEGVPEVKLESVPEGKMEGVPEPKIEGVTEAKKEDVPEAKKEDLSEAQKEDVPEAKMEDVPDTKVEGAPEAEVKGGSEAKPEEAPKAELEGVLEAQLEGGTPPPEPKAPAEAESERPPGGRVKAKDIQWPSPTDPVPFWEKPVTPLAVDAAKAGDGGVAQDPHSMHIVHVTAEMAPLAKVGGLGDVVTGLARACLARGHRVEVFLPFYECIDTTQVTDLHPGEEYNSFHRGGWVNLQVFRGGVSGVPVLFFKPANHFFRGSRIYGGSYDELEAYLFFSRAVLEYLQVMGQQPDVIHIHEWHTSGVALLYWDMYHALGLTRPRIALTIHNMEHHGECRQEQLDMCGLDGSSYLVPDKAIDDRTIGHNPERCSLLKGGIVYSNVVTTVSPTYAEETLCSGWLASALMRHRGKYHGVLNGIDTVLWDPERDPHLPATFGADDLEGKRVAKHYVQRGLGLATDLQTDPSSSTGFGDVATRQPLVVCVTRLVAQKGVHLIRHAIFRTAEQGGQFILLGSAPDPRIQAEFQQLADQFRDSASVRLLLTYSESLAHLLFAAADVLLVPSMFEPCGLTQMIAMRYGTIPVVRRTGGLADTVFDVDNQGDQERANGYVFDGIGEGDLNSALDRALRHYKENPEEWDRLASKVMKIDNSWNKSAGQYLELYSAIRV